MTALPASQAATSLPTSRLVLSFAALLMASVVAAAAAGDKGRGHDAPAAPARPAAASAAPAPAPAAATMADDDQAPHGVRLYELYQQGPELRLDARLSKIRAPHYLRNILPGQTWPPSGQPPLRVEKVRGHVAFLGSCFREDGTPDRAPLGVAIVLEAGEDTDPGTALLRVKIAPLTEVAAHLHDGEDAHALGLDAGGKPGDGPLWGATLFEVFQRGKELVLSQRTSRLLAPHPLLNLPLRAVYPPDGKPALTLWRSRSSLGYWGAGWRMDGAEDHEGHAAVVLVDASPTPESDVAMARCAVVPVASAFRGGPRYEPHPRQGAEAAPAK